MKSVKERIIYITGTGLGSGYAPVAPGTAGSLLGLLIYIVIPANQIIGDCNYYPITYRCSCILMD